MRWVAFFVLVVGCGDRSVSPPPEAGAPQAALPLAVLSVHAASETTFAWMSNGTVRAWGANGFGQLGWGQPEQDTATPVQVEGLTDVDALFVGGTSATTTACARLKGGAISCWGHADLIVGHKQHRARPVAIAELFGAKALAIGGGHACAIQGDGTVSCWGYGAFGALGLGATKRNKRVAKPTTLEGLTGAVSIAAGQNHTCVLHEDGGASCWGSNFEGQSDPKNPGTHRDVIEPQRVEGVSDAVAIAAGSDLTCALLKDASVRCWGKNFGGAVATLPNASGTKALWSGFADHACIIRDEGQLWCWGDDGWGQASGAQPGGPDARPRRVTEPTCVTGLSGVTSVATAFKGKHTCVVVDGIASCWGRNRFGALGKGNVLDQWEPRAVLDVTRDVLPAPRDGHDEVAAIGSATSFDALPKECARPGRLALRVAADPRLHAFEIVSAEATRRPRKTADGSEGTRYGVTLRNYTFDGTATPWQRDQLPRGKQLMLTLTFQRDEVSKEGRKSIRRARPVVVGAFDVGRLSGGDRRALDARGQLRRIEFDFRRGRDVYAGATITHLGDDWICGELSLKNDDNELSGTFAAPIRAAGPSRRGPAGRKRTKVR